MSYMLSDLVARFGGVLRGNDVAIVGVAPTDLAQEGYITFLTANKYKKNLAACKASAIILGEGDSLSTDIPAIIAKNPYFYFQQVSDLFHPRARLQVGVSPTCKIDATSVIGAGAAIADYVVIGKNCKIGVNCQIHPHVVIDDNVVIGDNVLIYPNVTIYTNVTMGNHCVLHSGVVVGSDGFGYAPDKDRHWCRIPQVGGVIIGNNVEIGVNTAVDSGTLSPTVIEDGVIIDNLVQIAHNVTIGAHTAIAGLAGIAGGTKIGKYCQLGGGCGINGHIEICDNVVIGGKTVVHQSITDPGLYAAYYPAMTYKDWARSAVHIKNLHTMNQRIQMLEEQLQQLKGETTYG